MSKYLLVINPGSTSTKIAITENDNIVVKETLKHSDEELAPFSKIGDQYDFRKEIIFNFLKEKNIDLKELKAVVGRGGLLKPIQGGTYKVNEKMLEDLKVGVLGEHASNLGGLIANAIATYLNIPAFIVDPVVVDEMEPLARYSGMPEIERLSIFHALNQKAIGRQAAKELGKKYNEVNLVVVHMGGGISVGAHKKGRVIDVNNALDGDGPFSPERSGDVPIGQLVKMCYSGKYTLDEIKKKIKGKGGLVAYMGTNDAAKIEDDAVAGDKKSIFIYQAMAYQIAKEIGAYVTVLKGDIDAIVLTGGLAYSKLLTEEIKPRVSFMGKIMIFPGEDEITALSIGANRVINGLEKPKIYE